jgi:hypothetical protein
VAKFIEITLEKRNVTCRARLLEDEAPQTCEVVLAALPLRGDVFHATYARHEIYTLIPPFAAQEPPLEYATITPIPGDVCYYPFSTSLFSRSFRASRGLDAYESVVDLAVFYGRNNLVLSPDLGFVSCTVFATIEENLAEMATACTDVWQSGSVGESLKFSAAS